MTRTSESALYEAAATSNDAAGAAPEPRNPRRYRVLGEHGRGGLGRVSRVHDRDLGRDIAIKELISRGNVREVRFLREALITARLEHPGIVPVYEAGRWPDGTPFYAMKLVAGRSLRELITERTTLDERIGLLDHVIAVADAIAYAHGRNIIHRDLKPANVIVGDFGETIVIDWGLAKDLSASDDSEVSGGPSQPSVDDGLTSAGTVLGTPAYMAPEQERGDRVDQRADVFAIGVMLWELCTLRKLPPRTAAQRARILRRSGIDRDLAVIINKALEPDPEHRYGDAGALAADLKAFRLGARIAARRYSLWAMLAHWTRRHRPLALSLLALIALATLGAIAYVHEVTAERDRADVSEQRAERDRAAALTALDDLTLQHAELLLATDPSAAVDLLATAHSGSERAKQIRAEAVGRGVAVLRAKPHTDTVRWVTGTRDGAIVSLSTDGKITRTTANGATTVVATGVSPRGRFAFAAARGLLAYGCDPADVCLWDVMRGVPVPSTPALRNWQLAGIAFSPNGNRLALLSDSGKLRVFDVSEPSRPVEVLARDHGIGIIFADDNTLAVGVTAPLGLELVRMNGTMQFLPTTEYFLWEASSGAPRFVLATEHGEGIYLDVTNLHVLDRAPLCQGYPTSLKFLRDQRAVAYTCRSGAIGKWNLDSHTTESLMHLEGPVDRLALSEAGDYLLAGGGNGVFVVIDLRTRMISSYRGHGTQLTAVAGPTAAYPYLISGDARGALRAWAAPSQIARVVDDVKVQFLSAVFDRDDEIVAAPYRNELTVYSPREGARTITPHLGSATRLEISSGGKSLAAYGPLDSVELWDAASHTLRRVIGTGHGVVSRVAFVGVGDDLVTSGRDGRLLFWPTTGEPRQLAKLDQPIASFVFTKHSSTAVIATSDGALWRSDVAGPPALLRAAGPPITHLIASPDETAVAITYGNGHLVVLDTRTWLEAVVLRAEPPIRDVAFDQSGSVIAVADGDNRLYLGRRTGDVWTRDELTWTHTAIRAAHLAFTPDGLLVVLCSDGSIWLYSSRQETWLCLPTGTANLTVVATSPDGKAAASFDSGGRVIWLDLDLARKSLAEGFDIHVQRRTVP